MAYLQCPIMITSLPITMLNVDIIACSFAFVKEWCLIAELLVDRKLQLNLTYLCSATKSPLYFTSRIFFYFFPSTFTSVEPTQHSPHAFNPILLGGGQICPHHHVFAYTRVCMRIRVLIFCDFSSFWVWKRVQHVWPQKKSPFSQELRKLVRFAQLS